MAIILGIDPGSRITGYGVIRVEGNRHQYLASGCIRLKADNLSEKLEQIHHYITQVIHEFRPTEAAVEQVFMHKNPGAALKLGQARGAAIVAIANLAIPVAEYSAKQIKQSVVGYGAAQKSQMQQMMKTLLNLSDIPQEDAADALAAAFCHCLHRKSYLTKETVT